jgi:PPM family protein phosphatase
MAARSPIDLQYALRSDPGSKRRTNEDTCVVESRLLPDGRSLVLAAVADGMSGSRAGAEASQLAVGVARAAFWGELERAVPRSEAQWRHLLVVAVRAANEAVHIRGIETRRSAMGTTLMLALVIGHRAHIVHVGDCRAYAVRPAVRRPHIRQLTAEHTVVAEMVDQGALSYAEANGHPQRHQLARALGSDMSVDPEYVARTLRAHERLLLCSDGVPLHLSDADIARAISDAPSPQSACDRLVDLANARGGRDNLSAVVISFMPQDATSRLLPPS